MYAVRGAFVNMQFHSTLIFYCDGVDSSVALVPTVWLFYVVEMFTATKFRNPKV